MASGSVDQIENGAFGDSNAGRQKMTLNLLDVVILQRDFPEHGLAAGDLGTIVELYGDTAAEVEFVRASGRTQALVELAVSDLREVRDEDLLTVRQVERVA